MHVHARLFTGEKVRLVTVPNKNKTIHRFAMCIWTPQTYFLFLDLDFISYEREGTGGENILEVHRMDARRKRT
jgi:hypothetical protein